MNNRKLLFFGKAILTALTVISILFGFYTWFYEKKPNVNIEINGTIDVDVLAVNKNVDNLKILYNNQILDTDKVKLNVIKIYISNNGSEDILQNMYDNNSKWGIKIDNANLIKTTIINASNDYIKNNIKLDIENNQINFYKIILEKQAYFEFEVLLLYNKSSPPLYTFFGKIAGVDTGKVVINDKTNENKKNFWESVFYGNIVIQIVKTFAYFIIGFIVFMIIGLIIYAIVDSIISKKKNHRKAIFTDKIPKEYNYYNVLSKYYTEYGKKGLRKLFVVFGDEKELRKIVIKNSIYTLDSTENTVREMQIITSIFSDVKNIKFGKPMAVLIEGKVLSLIDNKIHVDELFVKELIQALDILQ
jgi:hypothetical protein